MKVLHIRIELPDDIEVLDKDFAYDAVRFAEEHIKREGWEPGQWGTLLDGRVQWRVEQDWNE